MKGVKKCFGVLLVLSIMVGLSLSVYLEDSSALLHDYSSVPLLTPYVSYRHYTNGHIDWDYNYTYVDSSNSNDFISAPYFVLRWEGDGYYSDLENLAFKDRVNPLIIKNMGYDGTHCTFTNLGFNSVIDGFQFAVSSNDPSYHYGGVSAFNTYYDNRYNFSQVTNQALCFRKQQFNVTPEPPFTTDGMSEVNKLAYLSNLDPYWYAYDGFYIHSSFVSDSGVHYNHSFSFSDIFNQNIKKFSQMTIPLYDYSDYWTNPSNFTQGRQVEWRGAFKFDESFTMNSNMPSTSYFRVKILYSSGQGVTGSQYIPCTFNTVTLPDIDYEQLEYTCSGVYLNDMVWAYPALEMYAPDSYIFETTGKWYFANQMLITDGDDTRGQSFGSLDRGFGDARSDAGSGDTEDWFSSLVNLFNFGLINPFAPIFELFSDQSTCASIPTLAGMLHSTETQVCPWFSAETRAIVTPVIGLSSMMLLFGFVVRWLGSGSGNMLEDSLSADNIDAWSGNAGNHIAVGRFERRHKK